ncbi:hypothetical protein SAMN05444273_102224 [Litoreibacter ascidiaceicola]|uniref:Sulfotransferase family protein n=1 Tax=Litoreibacter ascidiaceicola TaxID=1486859 RepID=A0A1M4VDW8_9RHOB|nr:hypothetical protein [Litoreibacter ascidiaceicola]SHE67201.1 hypothetical protein SAMN05444273_102224 [Litoreibacter ascidiaceicola]
MGKIWLHIGSPKTGTTSLQNFLNDNANTLRDTGRLNFMSTGRAHIAHNQLAASARTGNATKLMEDMLRESDAMPDITHVASSEMLFNLHTARKLSSAAPVEFKQRAKVICYIRRQDSYLEALYKQLLKNSRIPPDRQAFLDDAKRRLHYLNTFNTYADMFGEENIIVRPFGPKWLVDGDVVRDFAHHLGMPITHDLRVMEGFSNKTFSAEMSELLSLMGERTDFNTREVIRELIALNHPGTIKSRDVFSRSERLGLMNQVTRENRRLVKRFMPDCKDFFLTDDLEGEDTSASTEDQLASQLADRAAATEALLTAMGNLQARRKQEAELAAKTEDIPAASPANDALEETLAPPTWYREIYPGGDKRGWFHSHGSYAASFVERDTDQLVVSFDNLSQAGNDAYAREPWAQKFCADREFSHLGIYAQEPTWFRDEGLIAHLEGLRDEGFFSGFKKVAFVGTSMGAFGALTFSSLAPGAKVVAFSPQTTLDAAKVPWEGRFAKGRAADWGLPYSDASEQTKSASQVYLIYDQFHEGDRKHVERLKGGNLVHLKGAGLGHKSALVLSRMNVLKDVMEGAVEGTLSELDFYRAIRARKDIYLYRQAMEGYLTDRGNGKRAERFANAFKKRRRLQNAS